MSVSMPISDSGAVGGGNAFFTGTPPLHFIRPADHCILIIRYTGCQATPVHTSRTVGNVGPSGITSMVAVWVRLRITTDVDS